MVPSNTICVSQEGPANALALNKDSTQVVIAGRNVFKVFSIGENEFTEVCNLRVGKNLNLNFSSIDVAWSSIEENTLATAATNGAVVVWNLGRSGRSKQEHVFSDHKRTVNKVSFHLTEPALLISGSQDGMMKCFDLRMKEVAKTFISNTESIRDVQFSPHAAHQFAAVSETGLVQMWDGRKPDRPLVQFTAHSGPVFACDWHPERPWIATASRDKTIKVWDMQVKPNLEHTIYTIASVGHVKWRPQKMNQVSSCALVLDCAVHVWDVRRPHVPLATFAEQRDVTTGIAWLAGPHAFLSTSRDCGLYRHRFVEAAHPVLWANPHAVAVSARGHCAAALPATPLPALRPRRDARAPARDTPLGRKQPTAGSLSAPAQAALEAAFPGAASSRLLRLAADDSANAALLGCARDYRMRGAPAHELAAHNAAVARRWRRHLVAHVWEVVVREYSARAAPVAPPPPPAAPPPRPDSPPPPAYPAYQGSAGAEEEPAQEPPERSEAQFHNSGVLGLPTHTLYIPPVRRRGAGADEGEEGGVWVSAATAHYVDVEAIDWALPEEAFPLRAPPQPPAPPHPDLEPHHNGNGANGGEVAAGSSPSSASSGAAPAHVYSHQASLNSVSEGEAGPLCVRAGSAGLEAGGGGGGAGGGGVWAAAVGALAAALLQHADLGDVQTPAVVMIALQDHRSDLFPYIDESIQEQWLLGYIEVLQRHKLFNVATMVIKVSWIGSVWAISQQSTSLALCCARCGRRARPRQPCDRCAPLPQPHPDLCAVCHRIVRGLYAWCQGCSHGGHLLHMQQWAAQHQQCPAGCGHLCQLE